MTSRVMKDLSIQRAVLRSQSRRGNRSLYAPCHFLACQLPNPPRSSLSINGFQVVALLEAVTVSQDLDKTFELHSLHLHPTAYDLGGGILSLAMAFDGVVRALFLCRVKSAPPVARDRSSLSGGPDGVFPPDVVDVREKAFPVPLGHPLRVGEREEKSTSDIRRHIRKDRGHSRKQRTAGTTVTKKKIFNYAK